MTDIRRIGDSGVHTVEGAVSGNRAVQLTKQRNIQQQEYQAIKNKIKNDHSTQIGSYAFIYISSSMIFDEILIIYVYNVLYIIYYFPLYNIYYQLSLY